MKNTIERICTEKTLSEVKATLERLDIRYLVLKKARYRTLWVQGIQGFFHYSLSDGSYMD